MATTLDGQYRITFPEAESVRARAFPLVVTLENVNGDSTHIRVRDIRSGEVVGELEWEAVITEAIVVGENAYLTGYRKGQANPDVGVLRWALNGDSVDVVVQPRLGPGTRGNLQRSPSGHVIASQFQPTDDKGFPSGDSSIEVATLETGETTTPIPATASNLMAISDDTIVTRDEHVVRAYSLADGTPRWEVIGRGTQAGYVTSDGRSLIQPYWPSEGDGHLVLVTLDLSTGATATVYTFDTAAPRLIVPASNDQFAIFRSEQDDTSFAYVDIAAKTFVDGVIPGGQ